VSPKSRGRAPGRGRSKSKKRNGPVRELRLSDRMMQDARALEGESSTLAAEIWASGWLGHNWLAAPVGDRDAEYDFLLEIVGRACNRPSSHGLAAIEAVARVAPQSGANLLAETVEILAKTQRPVAFDRSVQWRPVAAWRAVDVWGCERVLFIDFDGPQPHTLMAVIVDLHGAMVQHLDLLEFGSAPSWASSRGSDEILMSLDELTVDEALTDLAHVMRVTDMLWPRQDEQSFVELRSIAWTRCRDSLSDWPDFVPLTDDERKELIDRFVGASELADDSTTRSLADLFVDYGDGYLGDGPLGWSPEAVDLFMTDWVPRKVALDAEQRTELPEALRQWIRFALHERGVEDQWIEPVLEEVDACLEEFEEAFDDESAWGPAKQLVQALEERGVDLSDREAVELAISQTNASQLARRLTDPS